MMGWVMGYLRGRDIDSEKRQKKIYERERGGGWGYDGSFSKNQTEPTFKIMKKRCFSVGERTRM